jgi:eukaryotic-like serine/threonine-protein kinase
MALAAGTHLGPYEILDPIGEGGMGEVYRARDPRLDRIVAIKLLPAAAGADQHARERLRFEAMAAAALDHPYICKIFEIAEDGGTLFLVMEYIAGENLQRRMFDGRMPFADTLRVAGEIAEALQEAHARGILHRDLKPANIMLTEQGHVKIMDFGLAKRLVDLPGLNDATVEIPAQLTMPGTILGTPDYMSPEQVKGLALDVRSDLFSFGVLLAEMAGGQHPFRKTSMPETLAAVLREPPELSGDIPPGLLLVLRRLLAKTTEERYASVADVRADLARLLAAGEKVRRPTLTLWKWPALASLAILVGLAIYLVPHFGISQARVIRSIAVLPLDNYSGDPSQEYFAEGMTDELTADLATISQLRVISRGSVMQFKGEHRPPTPEIAKILNVDAVVEGSVLRAGDNVRITAQLIDAREDKHLWAKKFERNSRDVLALQDELASAIAHEIDVRLTPAEQSRLRSAPVVNPEAHDAYLKGRYFFNRPSDENLQKSIAQFEEAVKLNPNFAPAYSGLSDAYLWAGYNEGVITSAEAKPKAKAAAEKAIQLDDNSAEAHTSLAVFKLFYEFDWEGSECEFRRAFELNPNYAFAHDQFGLGLSFQGRLDESIAEGKRASALDPYLRRFRSTISWACVERQIPSGDGASQESRGPGSVILLSSVGIWLGGYSSGENRGRDSSISEGESDGVARFHHGMARVRVWGVRRSNPRAGGDRRLDENIVARPCSAIQLGDSSSRIGRSRARIGLPGTGLRIQFAMDGPAQRRPDFRSTPIGAAICCADEETEIRKLNRDRKEALSRTACAECMT